MPGAGGLHQRVLRVAPAAEQPPGARECNPVGSHRGDSRAVTGDLRVTAELPADTLFTEIELAALEDFAQDRRQPPPDNLGRAVLTLAMLGGYLNYKRKQYAVPGHKVMWEGYTRLATISQVVERTQRLSEGSKLYQKMRPA